MENNNIRTTYCNGKHNLKIEPRTRPHPAVVMSKARIEAFEKYATDEELYEHLQVLASIYAKRHHVTGRKLNENMLFIDYKKYADDATIRLSSSSVPMR